MGATATAATKATATGTPGVIEPGVSYTLDEFRARTRMGRFALRTARGNGLNVIYTAGRAYVRGDDWLTYLGKQGGSKQ